MQDATVMLRVTHLASLRLTLAAIVWLAVSVWLGHDTDSMRLWLLAPLAVLAVNLVAAIASNRRLQREVGLLGFHLCLLALVALLALRELVSFEARVEIVEGSIFDPATLAVRKQGPWHRLVLADGIFEQREIAVGYGPGVTRGRTSSHLRLADGREVPVGDDRPLVSGRYRFYTTSNKGFAALFTWAAADGTTLSGAVHLPSYPIQVDAQHNAWVLPNGERAEVRLPTRMPEADKSWVLQHGQFDQQITLLHGGRRTVLTPGEAAPFAGGQLRFDALRMWMGYEVRYEPILPWLFMTAMLGVGFMFWHFRRAFMAPKLVREGWAGAEVGLHP